MVASRPKMLPCKILLTPEVLPRNVDRTFPFDETNELKASLSVNFERFTL